MRLKTGVPCGTISLGDWYIIVGKNQKNAREKLTVYKITVGRRGAKLEEKRSNIGVKRFLRFWKNGQFPDMRSSGGKTIKHVKNTKLCPTKNLSENVLRRCESIPDGLSTCKNMF